MRKLFFFNRFQICLLSIFTSVLLVSCGAGRKAATKTAQTSVYKNYSTAKTLAQLLDIDREKLIDYARQFIGTPYKYGSINPVNGFDCSGFVYHVLINFNVNPPRSTYEYENVGIDIAEHEARPGDIILFTGSDNKKIGHMGIITENENDTIKFLHSATSRNVGVIESSLAGYYRKHFVKVIRILK